MCNKRQVKDFMKQACVDDPSGRIFLTTLILGDGLGDAGQLGILYHELYQHTTKQVYVIPGLCDPSVPRQESIRKLIPCEDEYFDWFDSDPEEDFIKHVQNINSSIGKKLPFINKQDYIIFYPYTIGHMCFPDIHKSDQTVIDLFKHNHILLIKEMGDVIKHVFKTGEYGDGIGYGIPRISETSFEMSTKIPKDIPIQWLVSTKSYTGFSGVSQDTKEVSVQLASRIMQQAAMFNIEHVVFLTDKKEIQKIVEDFGYLWEPPMEHDKLTDYMNRMQGGLIISGGEGMFVESIGSTGDAVPVFCGHYNYQYQEIAISLLQMSENIFDYNPKEFRFCYDQKERLLYFDDDNFLNVLDRFKPVKDIDFTKSSYHLQALYLPLCLNYLSFEVAMPQVFQSDNEAYTTCVDIFRQLKFRLLESNWLNVFD